MENILIAIAIACHVSSGVGSGMLRDVQEKQKECQKRLAECVYKAEAGDKRRTLTAQLICFKDQ